MAENSNAIAARKRPHRPRPKKEYLGYTPELDDTEVPTEAVDHSASLEWRKEETNEARQLAFDRAIKAGATPSGARVAAEALDFIPGVGEGLAARDVYQSLKRGDYLGAGIHGVAGAMGVIPVVGDVAGKAVKAGAKKLRKSLGSKSEEISIFPKPQKMFPENARPVGGEYLNPATQDILTDKNMSSGTIAITPEGKPSFRVNPAEKEIVGSPDTKGATQIKTNLFKKKAGWKWTKSPKGYEDVPTLVSVENKGKHYYTLEAEFPNGINLTRYPKAKSEPRLRPTIKGIVELGEEVGKISVRGKEHPVYDKISNFSQGGLVKDTFQKGGTKMATREELYDDTGAQMELAGLVSEPTDVDPVSGNEIPIGATAEGVRDDQTASISPGEFVIPDYAVRYHGLDFYVDSLQKAKQGLDQMQGMGLVGNPDEQTLPAETPLPSMEEEEMPPSEMAGAGAEQAMSDTGEPMPTAEFQAGGVVMSDTGKPMNQQQARPTRSIQEIQGIEKLSVSEKELAQKLLQYQKQQQPEQRQEFQTGGLATTPLYSPTQQVPAAPVAPTPPVQPIRPISTQPVPTMPDPTAAVLKQPVAPLLTQYQQGYFIEIGEGYYSYKAPPGFGVIAKAYRKDDLPADAIVAPVGTKPSDVWGTSPGPKFTKGTGYAEQSPYLAFQGPGAGGPGGYQVEAFRNEQGNIVYLTTVGGRVQGGIPPGYTKASPEDLGFGAPRVEPRQTTAITQQQQPSPDSAPTGPTTGGQIGGLADYSSPDLAATIGEAVDAISQSYSDPEEAIEAGTLAGLNANDVDTSKSSSFSLPGLIGRGVANALVGPIAGVVMGAASAIGQAGSQSSIAAAQSAALGTNNTFGIGNFGLASVYGVNTPFGIATVTSHPTLGVDEVQAHAAVAYGINPNTKSFNAANFTHDANGTINGYNGQTDLFGHFEGTSGPGTFGAGGAYSNNGTFVDNMGNVYANGPMAAFNALTADQQQDVIGTRGNIAVNHPNINVKSQTPTQTQQIQAQQTQTQQTPVAQRSELSKFTGLPPAAPVVQGLPTPQPTSDLDSYEAAVFGLGPAGQYGGPIGKGHAGYSGGEPGAGAAAAADSTGYSGGDDFGVDAEGTSVAKGGLIRPRHKKKKKNKRSKGLASMY